jgi:hypothetical protein
MRVPVTGRSLPRKVIKQHLSGSFLNQEFQESPNALEGLTELRGIAHMPMLLCESVHNRTSKGRDALGKV